MSLFWKKEKKRKETSQERAVGLVQGIAPGLKSQYYQKKERESYYHI
jgi:hypothetical protein